MLELTTAALMIAGCTGSDAPKAHGPLRVGAGHQLTCFRAQTGTAAYARELVSPFVSEYATVDTNEPAAVALHPRPDSPYTAAELCAHVLAGSPDRIETRIASGNTCTVTFQSADDKNNLAGSLRVNLGPYRLQRFVALGEDVADDPCPPTARESDDDPLFERIELRARTPQVIDEIHLVAMPLQEQWRRLFAREIDVIASTPTRYFSWFLNMHSVRTVVLPSSSALALYFNMRTSAWTSRDVRKRLAAALDLDAISRVACHAPQCRDLGPLVVDPRKTAIPDVALPEPVSLCLMVDDVVSVKAAKTIHYQLYKKLDIDIELLMRPITDLRRMIDTGECGLFVLPLPLLDDGPNSGFVDRLAKSIDWHDPRLVQAVEQGRDDQIAMLLEQELPVLPLFRYLQFAAIDQRFCGAQPKSQISWRWLSDLRPCGDEDPQ